LLGVPLIDYAWGGATTGIGNEGDGGTPTSFGALGLPGMTTVYNTTKGSLGAFLPDALFMVWGGPNDFASPSPLDTTPTEIADRAVADLLGIVAGLQGLGARNILVPGLPDLGLTPLARSLGPAAAAQASVLTDYFNGRLTAALPSGVTYVDTADLLRDIVTNPGSYGFTNVTDACYSFATSSLCANPDQYLFFDASHPTARAHAILAEEFAEAVPEPATWRFVLSGIVLLTVGRLVTRRPR
jgi:phospholipase/lecithinase/hemolysin